MTVHLTGLVGTNPLGFLAALGALDAATRIRPEAQPRLWWADGLEPSARLDGLADIAELVDTLDTDRRRWQSSPLLDFELDGKPIEDAKLDTAPHNNQLRRWMEHVHTHGTDADIALLHALVAEGATAAMKKSDAKPTYFDFTSGNQHFLAIARELRDGVDQPMIENALTGPWKRQTDLSSFRWDTSRGPRLYALSAKSPTRDDKPPSVPGADWLAFLGLRYFPVAARSGGGQTRLVTTGCIGGWKDGTFTWPLWGRSGPQPRGLSSAVVASIVADQNLATLSSEQRRRLGIFRLLQAPIVRPRYGHFGPATITPPPTRQRRTAPHAPRPPQTLRAP